MSVQTSARVAAIVLAERKLCERENNSQQFDRNRFIIFRNIQGIPKAILFAFLIHNALTAIIEFKS